MPDFVFSAQIVRFVFGEAGPQMLGVPMDLKGDLYNS